MNTHSNKKLQGQTALVTGGSSGIGKAVVYALAGEGANVVINYYNNSTSADAMVSEISGKGGKATAVQGDVGNEEEVRTMFKKATDTFGTLDILVSNAGIQQDAHLMDMTLAQWEKVINTNLTGAFLCAREAAKEFKKRGVTERSAAAGKIIFMSSVHEVIPWAGHCNYAASKGGIMLLMKSLALELAPLKIRVNSIGPGAIQTAINKDAWDDPQDLNSLLTKIPYNRIGQPEDIAKAVAWLASDEADYITGTTLYIDGGMTLYPSFYKGG